MKYSLCRLCLTVLIENEEPYRLFQGCEMLSKIRTCLSFSLTINEELPDKLCKKCVNKIEEINQFYMIVKVNEQMLQNHLANGSLVGYYLHLTNDVSIKKDYTRISIDETVNKNEIFVIKESDGPCEATTKNNHEIEIATVKVENNIDYEIDETVNNSTDEEDNVALSSFKHDKDSSNKAKINSTEVKRDIAINIEDCKKVVLEKYSCLTCNKMCESHNTLRDHYKQEHSNKNNKTIEPTYTKTVLNGKIMYKCDRCSKIYSRKNLKRHLLHHSDVRPYVCKLCSRSYITVSDIMRHGFRVHSGFKLLCAFNCGFSTAYSGALKTHEDRMHKNSNKYTCDICGKGFQAKTWHDQHQNVHTGLRPYICVICGHAFHMEKNLTSHQWNMHPGVDRRRLVCIHCNLKCENEKGLESHLQIEHGVTRKRPNRRKKALCDLCGKILNRPEDLVLHRRMHLGQKPYKCSICNKRFPRKFTMQVHERSHSRTNAHECDQCGKRYSQQSALYRHQRQHHALPLKRQKTVENS